MIAMIDDFPVALQPVTTQTFSGLNLTIRGMCSGFSGHTITCLTKSFILELDSQKLFQSADLLRAEPFSEPLGAIEHARHASLAITNLERKIRTSCPKCWKALPT